MVWKYTLVTARLQRYARALRAGSEAVMRFFYTYGLKGFDGELYIGWTKDLGQRVKMHNTGLVYATRPRRPLKLKCSYEACLTEKDAIMREKSVKTGFGKAYLKRRLTW